MYLWFYHFTPLERQSNPLQKVRCNSNNYADNSNQQVVTSIATTVAALACEYVYQKEEPADYGNGIQNTAPKIVPRRERSVRRRQKHIRSFGVDFLFHSFHPFFGISRNISLIAYHFFLLLARGFFNIFCFLQKYSCEFRKSKGVFHIGGTLKALPCQVSVFKY